MRPVKLWVYIISSLSPSILLYLSWWSNHYITLLNLYILLDVSLCSRPVRSDTVQLKFEEPKLYSLTNKSRLKEYITTHRKLDSDASKDEHVYFLTMWLNSFLSCLRYEYITNEFTNLAIFIVEAESNQLIGLWSLSFRPPLLMPWQLVSRPLGKD